MKKVTEILAQFFFRNEIRNNEIGGPPRSICAEDKRIPTTLNRSYRDHRSEDVKMNF